MSSRFLSPTVLIPPTAEQIKTIYEDINLKPEEHKRDTQALKEWLLSQPHLPHDIEDNILASFIVGCKNSLERSKKVLDAYLTNRTTHPDFYSSRDPCDPALRTQRKLFQNFVLPGMTPEGYRVTVIRISSRDADPGSFNIKNNAIQMLSSYDIRLQEDSFCAGDISVFDLGNMTLWHIQSLMSISILKQYIYCFFECLPVRQKRIIYFNMPSFMDPIFVILKTLMKQKIFDRFIMTSADYTVLHKYIPKDMLPYEYGGQAGNLEDLNDAWQLKMESYRHWFLKDMTRKVDESKRPAPSKGSVGTEGVIEGSFRKLTMD